MRMVVLSSSRAVPEGRLPWYPSVAGLMPILCQGGGAAGHASEWGALLQWQRIAEHLHDRKWRVQGQGQAGAWAWAGRRLG